MWTGAYSPIVFGRRECSRCRKRQLTKGHVDNYPLNAVVSLLIEVCFGCVISTFANADS